MTGIVLSAAVRQNLLSLQNTAQLLATTQNDLSTGNKVNSALDNPTSYFTAAALTDRAGDISNLLDGIGNGVQVLQAANTGITSLQSLVASAQSVANQVLQTPVGYDSKSSVATPPIAGANVNNLLGTGAGLTDATFAGVTATGTVTTAFTNASATGTAVNNDDTTVAPISSSTHLIGAGNATSNDLPSGGITNNSTLVVNGKTITFSTGATTNSGSASAGFTIGIGAGSTASVADVLSDIDAITSAGTASSVASGALVLQTGTAANLTITGSGNALSELGLNTGVTQARAGGVASTTALVGTTLLSGTNSSAAGALTTGFTAGDTLTVDGKTLTFVGSGASGANQINITDSVTTLLSKIDGLSGATGSSITGGAITLHTGTANANLTISSSDGAALAALGLGTSVSQAAGGSVPPLSGKTLLIAATGNGTPTSITFGTGAGQVSTLNQLNSALNANNLQATIDSTGVITIVTSNNSASATIGAISGTAAGAGNAFSGLVGGQPVADPTSQATRTGLINQYNNILKQIDTTSQDASFNGINLLQGDTLNLTFDETGKSTLAIQGVTFNTAGLSLAPLASGTDFLDSNSATTTLNQLNAAAATLRSEASNLGSNLSIVEIRQDFSKSLINVLQTGASNLTLADTNEEAANSQALSTRQSIAVSALALANQSQQSVLQLLR